MAEDPEEHTMTFWEHLTELRSRLIRALIAFVIGGAIAWAFKEEVLLWLVKPYMEAWDNSHDLASGASLHFQSPAAAFLAYIKLSILAGLVLALPVIFYQLWSFVAPGLYNHEKRLALPFVFVSTLLFVGGGLFGANVAFPLAFKYLLQYAGPVGDTNLQINPTVMIGDYLDFVSRMLLAFGIAFELPVLIFFLSFAGIITHRHLIRFARYFVVIAFVASAILTPPDITSQILLAAPLLVLYTVSIGVSWLVTKSRSKRSREPELDGADG